MHLQSLCGSEEGEIYSREHDFEAADVSQIAAKYTGGGGSKATSCFTVETTDIESLFVSKVV